MDRFLSRQSASSPGSNSAAQPVVTPGSSTAAQRVVTPGSSSAAQPCLSEQAEGTEEDWVRRVDKRTNAVKAIKRTETYARALLGCSHVPLSTHPEKDAFWPGAGVEMS
jgi:hypothetical protein